MLTKAEALAIVESKLQEMSTPDDPFVVLEKRTIEKPFGWVFFYNSKKFVETGEFRYRLAGNGPVIVNKHNGSVDFFGGAKPSQVIVADYEEEFGHGDKSQLTGLAW